MDVALMKGLGRFLIEVITIDLGYLDCASGDAEFIVDHQAG
ncbi:hypothetical protein [Nitrosomonas communis]|nr:hypothetical protein [Nitrosomonas communis]